MPDNFLFSAVVLMELIAGAADESERKRYEALARAYQKDYSLIVPNPQAGRDTAHGARYVDGRQRAALEHDCHHGQLERLQSYSALLQRQNSQRL
ncbi:MAG TPA: hypothetical protein VGV59_03725 [Pyrinomonadaceae bacterium]|nr:hypothetical protein [Pyrinomonadaceae bacterium]